MAIADRADEDLQRELQVAERELVQAKFKHSLGQLENTSVLRVHRRALARCLTELRSRETERGLAKNSLVQPVIQAPTSGSSEVGDQASGGFLSGIVDKLTQND
jgi:ribosomal protein L29